MGIVRMKVHYTASASCGCKIVACGNSETSAVKDWERKLKKHIKHCRIFKVNSDLPLRAGVITIGRIGS